MDSAPATTAAAEAALAPPAAPAAALLANNLPDYYAAALAPAQEFRVRPGRDTVLLGRQGTVVAVPAGAWAVPAGSGPVQLALREFYSVPDIIMAGLSTRSGASLLETGGMVHLSATAGGTAVALREGQHLLLRMPTARKLDGMRLYEGAADASSPHTVDWQVPPSAAGAGETLELWGSGLSVLVAQAAPNGAEPSPKRFGLEEGGRWPQFPGGQKAMLKLFDKHLPASRATLARLRRPRPVSDEEKQMLKAYSKANHKKVLRAVRVRLEVDSAGNTLAPQLLPNGDEEIGAAVLAAAAQMPTWRPARFRRLSGPHRLEKSNAAAVLSVLYTTNAQRLMAIDWDGSATHMPRIGRYVAVLEAEARRAARQQFAAQFASAAPLSLDANLYYELEAGTLGWINCDRLLESGPRIEFAVQTALPNTVVTLVFQQQRSILASSRTEDAAAIFAQVPAGAAATVVAIRREQGVTFLATAAATLGQQNPPALDFKPVSLEELRSALAKL